MFYYFPRAWLEIEVDNWDKAKFSFFEIELFSDFNY